MKFVLDFLEKFNNKNEVKNLTINQTTDLLIEEIMELGYKFEGVELKIISNLIEKNEKSVEKFVNDNR